MSDHHAHQTSPAQEYNPARDYKHFMEWSKYGIVACIVIIIALRLLIG